MKERLAFYTPIQYLKAVEMFRDGKKNIEVMEELYISEKAAMKIKKLIKESLNVNQIKQLK